MRRRRPRRQRPPYATQALLRNLQNLLSKRWQQPKRHQQQKRQQRLHQLMDLRHQSLHRPSHQLKTPLQGLKKVRHPTARTPR